MVVNPEGWEGSRYMQLFGSRAFLESYGDQMKYHRRISDHIYIYVKISVWNDQPSGQVRKMFVRIISAYQMIGA